MQAKLIIDNLVTYLYIGTTEQERYNKQKICWKIKIYFTTIPDACLSNDIAQTICYDSVAALVADICSAESYCLIEHLCYKVYAAIKNTLKADISVTIIKSPLNTFSYDAKFTINDLEKNHLQ